MFNLLSFKLIEDLRFKLKYFFFLHSFRQRNKGLRFRSSYSWKYFESYIRALYWIRLNYSNRNMKLNSSKLIKSTYKSGIGKMNSLTLVINDENITSTVNHQSKIRKCSKGVEQSTKSRSEVNCENRKYHQWHVFCVLYSVNTRYDGERTWFTCELTSVAYIDVFHNIVESTRRPDH